MFQQSILVMKVRFSS